MVCNESCRFEQACLKFFRIIKTRTISFSEREREILWNLLCYPEKRKAIYVYTHNLERYDPLTFLTGNRFLLKAAS